MTYINSRMSHISNSFPGDSYCLQHLMNHCEESMRSLVTLVLLVLIAASKFDYVSSSAFANAKAEELYTYVTGYNKDIRPCIGCGIPLEINITFHLSSLNDLDEVRGQMNSIGYLTVMWLDDRISWNPADYAGLATMTLPVDKIWTPTLLVGNPSRKASTMNSEVVQVRVMYDGIMIWNPGEVFLTKCYPDIYRYPYDVQECYISILPWGAMATEILLRSPTDTIYTPHYSDNGEWILKKTHAMASVDDGVTSIAKFTFTYYRRPQFFVVNVILPIILLSYLNCLVYLLPAESGERVSYSITVLLSFAVFMTLVSDNIPKTSAPMSLLCYYLISVFSGSTMVMISTIINMRILYRSNKIPISTFYRFLVKFSSKQFQSNPKVGPASTSSNLISVIELQTSDFSETTSGKELMKDPVAAEVTRLEEEEDRVPDMTWKDVAGALDTLSLAVFVFYFTASTIIQLLFIAIPTSQ